MRSLFGGEFKGKYSDRADFNVSYRDQGST